MSILDTPYYHCISRCVRRAFLCGKDPLTGFDFEHRRGWIVNRLKELSSIFAVDLCAFAVMSNHYHLVIHINQQQARAWSDREVVERWTQLFSTPVLIHRWMSGSILNRTERLVVRTLISRWRKRLFCLSWFMRCLNENIARMANREDDCTGRFWEGRFKSQALLDERAVISCMAYVDLNPIRAAIAKSLKESDFTSIQERIKPFKNHPLFLFSQNNNYDHGLPFDNRDYLNFLDWSGRAIIHDKKGYIPKDKPLLLQQLNMKAKPILDYLRRNEVYHVSALGPISMLRAFANSVGLKYIKGISISKGICPETG